MFAEYKREELRQDMMNEALKLVYPIVLSINATTGTFEVLSCDLDTTFIEDANGSMKKLMDKTLERMRINEREEFQNKFDVHRIWERFVSHGKDIHMEYRIKKKDGRFHWFAVRAMRVDNPINDDQLGILLVRNIDERKEMEGQLEAALDAAYESIPGGVAQYVMDEKFTIIASNPAFRELTGATAPEKENGYLAHIYPDDRSTTARIMRLQGEKKEPFEVTYRVQSYDGAIRWMQCRGTCVGERDNLPIYLIVRLDVTDVKQTQIELEEERIRSNLAFENLQGLIRFEYNAEIDTLFYSKSGDSKLRQNLSKTIKKDFIKNLDENYNIFPDDRDIVKKILLEKGNQDSEVRIFSDEEYKWYRVKYSELQKEDKTCSVVGIMEDIQTSKSLEEDNKSMNEQLGLLLQESFDVILRVNLEEDNCYYVMTENGEYKKLDVKAPFHEFAKALIAKNVYEADKPMFYQQLSMLLQQRGKDRGKTNCDIYFEGRIFAKDKKEFCWYTVLVKRNRLEGSQYTCLLKSIDTLKKQETKNQLLEQQLKYEKFSEQIIDTLGTLVEFRDVDSGAHIQRTRELTRILLKSLARKYPKYDLTPEKIEKISSASSMHDVGKISIPDAILNKPGRLNEEEFEIMKTHTTKGYEILKHINIGQDDEFQNYCTDICRNHHERWDGKGYPDNIAGEDIPIWSQVVSLVDVYDALVSPRVYKEAYSNEKAIKMIIDGECGAFNPRLIACLIEEEEECRKVLA